MVRVPGYPTSASLGHKTMPRTIQCPHCFVVLNVPEAAVGRRLKCPHCQSKFAVPAVAPEDSAVALPGSSGSIELPTSPAPIGGTYELPMFLDETPKSPPGKPAPPPKPVPAPAPVGDALALFQDEPKSARKPKGAEARANARRCPTCGGVVAVGMSLCNNCGLDLDTGQRIAPMEVFEDETPASFRPPMPPLGVLFVGSLCAAGNLLLAVASMVAWSKGKDGAQFLLIVWLFGIFASVQFLRRKAIRPLFLSLSLAVGTGVVYLIALPIYDANVTTGAAPIIDTPPTAFEDPDEPHIRPITDQLDMQKISWGIFSLLAYAGLTVYLNSPAIRREFKR